MYPFTLALGSRPERPESLLNWPAILALRFDDSRSPSSLIPHSPTEDSAPWRCHGALHSHPLYSSGFNAFIDGIGYWYLCPLSSSHCCEARLSRYSSDAHLPRPDDSIRYARPALHPIAATCAWSVWVEDGDDNLRTQQDVVELVSMEAQRLFGVLYLL